jgi:hypothetical protein
MEIEVLRIGLHLFLVVGGGIFAGVLAILCIIVVAFGVWLASVVPD